MSRVVSYICSQRTVRLVCDVFRWRPWREWSVTRQHESSAQLVTESLSLCTCWDRRSSLTVDRTRQRRPTAAAAAGRWTARSRRRTAACRWRRWSRRPHRPTTAPWTTTTTTLIWLTAVHLLLAPPHNSTPSTSVCKYWVFTNIMPRRKQISVLPAAVRPLITSVRPKNCYRTLKNISCSF